MLTCLFADSPTATPHSIQDVSDAWPHGAEVLRTLTFHAGHNTNTVILGTLLLGLAAGVIGVFALLRKRSLMTDALSHATLPGIGLAFLTATALGAEARSLPVLLAGAAITGVVGVLCIQALLRISRLHEDAAIGIVLSVFFGIGVVVLSYIQANAASGAAGLNTFIYGQTAAIRVSDAMLMGAIALTAILTTIIFRKEFALVCFNDTFARVVGWPVAAIDLIMMALVVVVTVAGLQAVGLILVVAMLIIPPVAARFWTERLWLLVILAGLIGAASGYFGSVVSALFPRKPAGAVIVLTAGAIFAISMIIAPARGVIAAAIRHLRLRLRIAGDDLLETAYEQHPNPATPATLSNGALTQLARVRGWNVWFRMLVIVALRRRRHITRNRDGVTLSRSGFDRGIRVNRNHKLWEQYLVSYADIAPTHVDWSVDQVEHVLSDELIAELEDALAARGIVVPNPPLPKGER